MKIVVVYLLALPLLVQRGVNLNSIEKERALGEQLASEVRKQSGPAGDSYVQAYAATVGRDLSAGLNDGRLQFQFEVISSADWTEPFALPGGFVFIPARIFINARDKQEFAGTLAHAMGHAMLRHGIRTAGRGESDTASAPFIFLVTWTGSHADLHDPPMRVPVSFREVQRTYELEADRFGLELLARTGYDASAFVRYVERTQPADSNDSPLPGRDLRIGLMREALASLPASVPGREPASARSVSDEFVGVQEHVRLISERSRRAHAPTLRR